MLYDLSKEIDKQKFLTRSQHLISKEVKVELLQKRKQRTGQQNKYLHVILSIGANEFGYDLNEWKFVVKSQMLPDLFRYEKNGNEFYKSTSSFDTIAMTLFIDKYRNKMSKDHGVYIPGPNETDIIENAYYQLSQYGSVEYL